VISGKNDSFFHGRWKTQLATHTIPTQGAAISKSTRQENYFYNTQKETMNCKEEAIEEDPADSPGSGAIVPVSSASFIRVRNASI
jgi:hypothetical protein